MAWRGLHLSQPARLSLRHGSLQVARHEQQALSFPLEDLGWIILDTPEVTATAAVMAACMQNGVPLVISDARHMPCGVLMPFHQHWQQAGIARQQLAASGPLRKRIWQRIIRCKLTNQALTLDSCQAEGGQALREMARHVGSGDPKNVEARGARFYWGRLFVAFRRHDAADVRNAMLNYGYAILRACIARTLVASGLLPAFGIHHAGAANPFNLADDLLEVFRPVVDFRVHAISGLGQPSSGAELSLADRRELAAILAETVIINGEQLALQPAIDRVVASLVRALTDGGADALELPVV
ncbi:MAG: type II CRISPR-associated endonuclease Cas1 [Minwuia sp.]|nr:type II CRISPR-associated endonuclease Cas1 [Minwuia sp.]